MRRDRSLMAIAFILAVAALRLSYPVTMPIVVAVFIIAAVWPIKPWLERRLPSSLSYAGTMLALCLILGGFLAVVYFAIAQVAQAAVEDQERFRALYDSYATWAEARGLPVPGGTQGYDRLVALAEAMFWRIYSGLGYVGVIAFLVFLGLPEVPAMAAKAREELDGEDSGDLLGSVERIAARCREYIGVTVQTSLITGVATGLWAFAVGLDLALTWGVLNFLLNFLPVIGNVVGIVPPVLYAMIQFEGWVWPVVVFLGFSALQIAISNVVFPMLQGRRLALAPVGILLALLVWGWLWGVVGALLAIPLTVAMIIVCQHFRSTEWVAKLLLRE